MASPFVAKDGSKHTNRETMKRADARHSASQPSPMGGGEGGEAGGEGADPQDGKAIAAEHGPAVEINIRHEGGKHSVHAEHEDGHAHDTEHRSKSEAHQFAADVAGANDDQDEDQGLGDGGAGDMYNGGGMGQM